MRKVKLSTRVLSLLLVVLTIVGIIPGAITTARASIIPLEPPPYRFRQLLSANPDGTLKNPPSPPNQILLKEYKTLGKSYPATFNHGSVGQWTTKFEVNGQLAVGFCTQYGKHIGTDLIDQAWTNPQKVTTAQFSEDIIRFLDFYAYQQSLHKEVHEHYLP